MILLATITLPFLIPAICIFFYFGSGDSLTAKAKLAFTLAPEKGLIKQGILWLAMISPACYFLTFGWFAWIRRSVDISSEGFATFLSISSLPLGLLSLSLPFSILVARFHATEQTAKQIEITSYKNNVDAYYTQQKALFDYFDRVDALDYHNILTGQFKFRPAMYTTFFSGQPAQGTPAPDNDNFRAIDSDLTRARIWIDCVLQNVNQKQALNFYLGMACMAVHRLARDLTLREIYIELDKKSVNLDVKNKKGEWETYRSIGKTADDLVVAFRYANDFFDHLCHFANYERSECPENLKYIVTGGKYQNYHMVIERLQEEIQHLNTQSIAK